jgi:hypothetical protein
VLGKGDKAEAITGRPYLHLRWQADLSTNEWYVLEANLFGGEGRPWCSVILHLASTVGGLETIPHTAKPQKVIK